MRSIEVSARTVAEAVELALARLRRDRDEVAIAVLDPGDAGGAALVRVSVVDDEEEEGDDYDLEALPIPGKSSRRLSEPNSAEVVALAKTMLEELLKRMDIHAYVTAVTSRTPLSRGEQEESTTIHIEGADEQAVALMIGRRGETLQSLQFLLNMLVSRKIHRWPQIVVDVGNYRQRRRESLEGLARRIAERVRESGRPIPLEPMPPYERRIIHMALRGDSTVYTQSSGVGESRKVVIYPARPGPPAQA